MKRIILVLAALGAAAGVSLPAVNYVVDGSRKVTVDNAGASSPHYAEAARIIKTKCIDCHSAEARLPFYARLPIARDLISRDMAQGRDAIELLSVLSADDAAVSETALAKLENTILSGGMPPMRYTALHWRSVLTGPEKAALLAWIRGIRMQRFASEETAEEFRDLPVQPLPSKVEADPKKAELGRKLFHDVRLSKTNTISCASCHSLDKGGTDQARTSTGINGQLGPINSPTVYNSGFQFAMFWDGRAKDLKEQAAGPVHNPLEMGSNWEEVIPKLSADPGMKAEFEAIYNDGITGDNITGAIAEFEKTLVTPDSRFDRYLRGDKKALDKEEEEGFRLFMRHGCTGCHAGKLLGGGSYEKMGRYRDYFAWRGHPTDADTGRFAVTQNGADRGKFKVPTLRNVEVTHPYFHDGSVKDLEEAVKIMSRFQTKQRMMDDEARKIAKYLRSLTGQYQGKPLA